MNTFDFDGYARLLARWTAFSQKHLYTCKENKDLICYGTGEHTNWGIQTNAKALSAFAVAACLEDIDFSEISIPKETVRKQALGMLRYMLHTHLVGDFACTSGEKWGHSWIYALSIERAFHAVTLLWDDMTETDKALLRAMMLSECDFLLNDYEIVAGTVLNNKPESNIWNGAILYRAAALYPDAENRELYLEKAYKFFANGISVEADQNSDETVGGKRIGDYFVGANLFDSFACNHHGYLNIGYMNICLSNIAMLHFFLKERNETPNPIIYHNLEGLWRLIRTTTFDDGRLLRIGGDTRARYCYCQDYALPTWALIEDLLGEDCTEQENGWLKILEAETMANADGSFLSERLGSFDEISPLYYTRLESDRANAISLSLYWHKKFDLCKSKRSPVHTHWEDTYHGAALVADKNRYASFTWRAAAAPQGLLAPKNDSALLEWQHNLCGNVQGFGIVSNDEAQHFALSPFDGGFLTYGATDTYTDIFLWEGQTKTRLARKQIAFAALPDESTVLCLQAAAAVNRVYIRESAGIFWNIPNDIFNESIRTIKSESGSLSLCGKHHPDACMVLPLGRYACVDGKIGIACIEPLMLVRRTGRQVDIKGTPGAATLYCEEICTSFRGKPYWADRGEALFGSGFALSLGGEKETEALSQSLSHTKIGGADCLCITAKDKKRYALAANFTDADIDFSAKDLSARAKVLGKESEGEKILLRPTEAVLLLLEA